MKNLSNKINMKSRIKNNITKRIVLFVIVLITSLVYSVTAFAKNNVSNINIDVLIHNNGKATITEQWVGTFNEGTEVYIPMDDNSLIISNFRVSMNGREFLQVEAWDVDETFEHKAFRCGINKTSTGRELCFGISNYGSNTYTFSYDVDPLAKAYDDADGFNFMFLNPNMSVYPSNVVMRLRLDNNSRFSEETARIWGFGFEGQTGFTEDGYAVAYTTTPLNGYNHMTVMMRIFKGVLAPNVKGTGTFEDLQNEAFVGSTYQETLDYIKRKNDEETFFKMIFAVIAGLGISGMIVTIVSKVKRKRALKLFYEGRNYFRDTPNAGNMAMSHALFHDFDIWKSKESNVIGAIIMKMINDKNLEPIQEKSYGFFGNEKINTSLKVGPAPTEPIMKDLYDMIIVAAGDDGVLQENVLKKYAESNYEKFNKYLDGILIKGRNDLNLKDAYIRINGNKLSDLTEVGKNELGEVYGLRKFLDEFTLINERSVTEGVIWENLMIYATLFGVAKKVLLELKKVYPDRIAEIENYAQTYYISDLYYRTLYYNSLNAKRAAQALRMAKMAADGLGGASSIGGGGGFSGGGSGGGTR